VIARDLLTQRKWSCQQHSQWVGRHSPVVGPVARIAAAPTENVVLTDGQQLHRLAVVRKTAAALGDYSQSISQVPTVKAQSQELSARRSMAAGAGLYTQAEAAVITAARLLTPLRNFFWEQPGADIASEQAALQAGWQGDTGLSYQAWQAQWNQAMEQLVLAYRAMAGTHENNTTSMLARDQAEGAKWAG
jgi:ESAT-6 family protein